MFAGTTVVGSSEIGLLVAYSDDQLNTRISFLPGNGISLVLGRIGDYSPYFADWGLGIKIIIGGQTAKQFNVYKITV